MSGKSAGSAVIAEAIYRPVKIHQTAAHFERTDRRVILMFDPEIDGVFSNPIMHTVRATGKCASILNHVSCVVAALPPMNRVTLGSAHMAAHSARSS